jgi:hypothetical protein
MLNVDDMSRLASDVTQLRILNISGNPGGVGSFSLPLNIQLKPCVMLPAVKLGLKIEFCAS